MYLEGTLLTAEGTETSNNVSMKVEEIVAGKESKPRLLVSALPVLINYTICPYLRNEI